MDVSTILKAGRCCPLRGHEPRCQFGLRHGRRFAHSKRLARGGRKFFFFSAARRLKSLRPLAICQEFGQREFLAPAAQEPSRDAVADAARTEMHADSKRGPSHRWTGTNSGCRRPYPVISQSQRANTRSRAQPAKPWRGSPANGTATYRRATPAAYDRLVFSVRFRERHAWAGFAASILVNSVERQP